MPRTCPTCGAEAPEQFRFCGYCGASLPPTPQQLAPALAAPLPVPVGERSSRRLVTVLFADLANFTPAAERADPEQVYLTVRGTLERLAPPVTRYGGRIDRYVGDGFLAIFGVPEAHEDDPARAVLAALEMQQQMLVLRREASERLGWEVQLRVGINTGPVISGQLHTGTVMDPSVFGHTVNLASRLQHTAKPGTTLVSEGAFVHTRARFNFREPVKLQLKGIDRPVLGYEVISQRADPLPTRGLSGRVTPLVGRSAEREDLTSGLQDLSVERRGMIALITGEAGVGKSRLVSEVLGQLSRSVHTVKVESSPTETRSYGLIARLAETLAAISPEDPAPIREQQLDALLAASEPLAREIGPVLKDLVTGQAPEERLLVDPQQQQRRIFAATRRLIAWLSRRRPLVLVLDDLQWADPSSLSVLGHVADLAYETSLAIIAIARDSARESLPEILLRPDPAAPAGYVGIQLRTLSPEESDHLVTLILSELAVPGELRRSIVRRTGGSPLLIEEMVRMLLDHEVIQRLGDTWELDPGWRDVIQNVPDTVAGLMLSRYDRLSPLQRGILDSAAVLGQGFSLPLLAAMTGFPDAPLRPELLALEQADYLRRTSGVPVYFFRHGLMQETIFHTLLQKERQALHLRAAQAIQQMAEELALDRDALIGYHLEQAKSPQAVQYLIPAAERAASRYANQEAIAYYQRVQALLEGAAEEQERRIDVGLGLAELLSRTNRLEAAREELQRCRALADQGPRFGYRQGDLLFQKGVVEAAQGAHAEALRAFQAAAEVLREMPEACQSFQHADLEREMGWVIFRQGQFEEAQGRAERALILAQETGDSRGVGSAHNLLAGIHYWTGEISESVSHAQEALALREKSGDIWGAAATQTNLGGLFQRLGEWTRAEALLRQAIFVQQEIGDHHGVGSSWNSLGLLLLGMGRYDEALYCMNQAIDALREQERTSAFASRYISRGQVSLRLGHLERAIADLEKGLAAATHIHNDNLRAIAVALLAETHLLREELGAASERVAQAETLLKESASPEARAEILRVQSIVLRHQNRLAEAREANTRAQDLFHSLGDRYEFARRQVENAEIHLAQFESEQALDPQVQAQVLEALATFRNLHASRDITAAEDLLARINSILQPSGPEEPSGARRPLAVVSLRLELPEPKDQNVEEQEALADFLGRLTESLWEAGRVRGSLVTTSAAGLTYLHTGAEAGQAPGCSLQAIESAQAALEVCLRLNRDLRDDPIAEIPICIGITSGYWPETIETPQQAALFVGVSHIGRRAQGAATLARSYEIILAGEVPATVRVIPTP